MWSPRFGHRWITEKLALVWKNGDLTWDTMLRLQRVSVSLTVPSQEFPVDQRELMPTCVVEDPQESCAMARAGQDD
jgi:hypothetical protein